MALRILRRFQRADNTTYIVIHTQGKRLRKNIGISENPLIVKVIKSYLSSIKLDSVLLLLVTIFTFTFQTPGLNLRTLEQNRLGQEQCFGGRQVIQKGNIEKLVLFHFVLEKHIQWCSEITCGKVLWTIYYAGELTHVLLIQGTCYLLYFATPRNYALKQRNIV